MLTAERLQLGFSFWDVKGFLLHPVASRELLLDLLAGALASLWARESRVFVRVMRSVAVWLAPALRAVPSSSVPAAPCRCTYAVGNHDFVEAYKCQTVIVQYLLSWARLSSV